MAVDAMSETDGLLAEVAASRAALDEVLASREREVMNAYADGRHDERESMQVQIGALKAQFGKVAASVVTREEIEALMKLFDATSPLGMNGHAIPPGYKQC